MMTLDNWIKFTRKNNRLNTDEHETPENHHNESSGTKGRRDSGSITEYEGTRMMTETLKKRAGGQEKKTTWDEWDELQNKRENDLATLERIEFTEEKHTGWKRIDTRNWKQKMVEQKN